MAASASARGLKRAGAFTLPASMAASDRVSRSGGLPKKRCAAASMPNSRLIAGMATDNDARSM